MRQFAIPGCLAVTIVAVLWLIAPGTFVFFDVTPKAVSLWGGIGRAGIGRALHRPRTFVCGRTRPAHGRGDRCRVGGRGIARGMPCRAGPSDAFRFWQRTLCVAVVPVSVYALAQAVGFDPWIDAGSYTAGGRGAIRPPAMMGHAIHLAKVLAPVTMLALAAWTRESGWWRAVCSVAVLLSAAALAVSGSRAATNEAPVRKAGFDALKVGTPNVM